MTDWSAGSRRGLAQRLLEQRDRAVDALELGEQEEASARSAPIAVSASSSVAMVRARVHSPAA